MARLAALGLARREDYEPWAGPRGLAPEIGLSAEALVGFCGDPGAPHAIVAPGDHRSAAPPGWTAGLWRPPYPVDRLTLQDDRLRWLRILAYTVIVCPKREPGPTR